MTPAAAHSTIDPFYFHLLPLPVPTRRAALQWLTIAFAALTLVLLARMLQCLWLSITPVLVRDQWFMLDELQRLHQGKLHLGYLWTPYWGQRIVIPRLLFWFDERFLHFSNAPLVAINVAAQAAACAVLLFSVRHLSALPRAFCTIAICHLCFSSLQMENFVYGMAVEFTLGNAAAVLAIALIAHARNSRWRFSLALACALFAICTNAAGLLLGPILLAEALYLRSSRTRIAWMIVLFAAVTTAYSIGFVNIGTGFGWIPMLRSPLTAIRFASMVLGEPLSHLNRSFGEVAGFAGMLTAAGLFVPLLRRARPATNEMLALASTAVFFIGVAFSIVAGRLSPAFVASFHGVAPIPSRYFSFALFFWSALLAAAWAAPPNHNFARVARAAASLAIAAFAVGAAPWQFQESHLWVAFTRDLEAAATSFFVPTDDPAKTAIIFPNQQDLDRWLPYLREHRLSVFHTPQANWIGQSISELLRTPSTLPCPATVSLTLPVNPGGRVTGQIPLEFVARYAATDLLFEGPDHRVIGLGRTLDPRHTFPPPAYPVLGYVPRPGPATVIAWPLAPCGK